ncbi:hypothetical protein C1H76_2026 [Elsinoe australis]|uniref:Uncharacterized protein n=1 Tax=Elsinoe australis TaxID=40998 RepID=A0A4U7B9U8_9PEZI|nr:hypothetical protein C1H76_2026 [Elsinoe australis]
MSSTQSPYERYYTREQALYGQWDGTAPPLAFLQQRMTTDLSMELHSMIWTTTADDSDDSDSETIITGPQTPIDNRRDALMEKWCLVGRWMPEGARDHPNFGCAVFIEPTPAKKMLSSDRRAFSYGDVFSFQETTFRPRVRFFVSPWMYDPIGDATMKLSAIQEVGVRDEIQCFQIEHLGDVEFIRRLPAGHLWALPGETRTRIQAEMSLQEKWVVSVRRLWAWYQEGHRQKAHPYDMT